MQQLQLFDFFVLKYFMKKNPTLLCVRWLLINEKTPTLGSTGEAAERGENQQQ